MICYLYQPSEVLKEGQEEKLAASALRLGNHIKEISVSKKLEYNHFYQELLNNAKRTWDETTLKCEIDCLKKRITNLQDHLRDRRYPNEAALRFGVVDPIVAFICKHYGLKVVVEASFSFMLEVGDETNITPGTQVHKSISRTSKSDYELGVAFDEDEPSEPIFATVIYLANKGIITHVIIEAEVEQRGAIVAQSLGYYIKAPHITTNPIVLIITERTMQFLFFPFNTKRNHYVDALGTKKIDYTKNDQSLLEALEAVLLFTNIGIEYPQPLEMDLTLTRKRTAKEKIFPDATDTVARLTYDTEEAVQKIDLLESKAEEAEIQIDQLKSEAEEADIQIDQLKSEVKEQSKLIKELEERLRMGDQKPKEATVKDKRRNKQKSSQLSKLRKIL